MGESNFTGIDRKRAEDDIHEFDGMAVHLLCFFNSVFDDFLLLLSQNWASPNA